MATLSMHIYRVGCASENNIICASENNIIYILFFKFIGAIEPFYLHPPVTSELALVTLLHHAYRRATSQGSCTI